MNFLLFSFFYQFITALSSHAVDDHQMYFGGSSRHTYRRYAANVQGQKSKVKVTGSKFKVTA